MKDAAVKAEWEETLGPNHAVWLEKQTNTALSAAFPLASVEQGESSAEPVAEKRWPFVETPVQFADRLAEAMTWAPSLLSALRHVLIENPAALSSGNDLRAVKPEDAT